MFMKRIATYAMIATMATATALTLPAPQAEAKDGRNGAFACRSHHRSGDRSHCWAGPERQ